MADREEEIAMESSDSPATPSVSNPGTPAMISNPGTPRSDMAEIRATPPPQITQHVQQRVILQPQSKYSQLLAVIEDMGRDIRPTYSGSKTSAERLKRGIVHARILVRECLLECERSARTYRLTYVAVMKDGMADMSEGGVIWKRNPDAGKIVTQHKVDTEYTADSVEWCGSPAYSDLLLLGTYQLKVTDPPDSADSGGTDRPECTATLTGHSQSKTPSNLRVGRLHLFSVQGPTQLGGDVPHSITEVQRFDTDGILDIKWNPSPLYRSPTFATAMSSGRVTLWKVTSSPNGKTDRVVTKLDSAQLQQEKGEECLALSIEWSAAVHGGDTGKVIASDSKGRLSILDTGNGEIKLESQWTAHEFEAWITAFDQWDTNMFYSGGDDCRLKGWDIRMNPKHHTIMSKCHSMGVCSIQGNPVREHLLATGSYDEHLLVWDNRQMRRPISDTPLSGGIWRLKWHPLHGQKILTATMHNGFHVIEAPTGNASIKIFTHYRNEEHGSLGYGADWSRRVRDIRDKTLTIDTVATCSFYDHSLHVWEVYSSC